MHRTRTPLAFALVAILAAACGPAGAASPSASPSSASRPSSPAVITITEPTQGQVVTGSTVHVVVALQGAKVVQQTTTHIVPTEGHVHLYLDNALVYMQYSLQQDLPVHPGTYTLRAEFVAADHAPFDPRVFSEQVIFTVK
ncbi:MAG: hypothetical protein EPN50_05245 [Chloroflexota bacterium]|nr:MAG: hypothetical protein EPN50_05245 [Chloroflexota bacterium]